MIAERAQQRGWGAVETYFGSHCWESMGSGEIGMVECLVWRQGELGGGCGRKVAASKDDVQVVEMEER